MEKLTIVNLIQKKNVNHKTSFYLSFRLSLCLSFCLSICLSVHLQYLSVCLPYAFLPVCPPVRLSFCLTANLSVCPPICLSVCLSVRLSVCLSAYLSVFPPASLSVRLPVCLSACLFVYSPPCLSVCLFTCQSICCLSVYLPAASLSAACLSVCPPFCLSICPCVSIYLSVCLSVGLFGCPSVCLYVCSPACLSVICLFVCPLSCQSIIMSSCLSACLPASLSTTCLPACISAPIVYLSACLPAIIDDCRINNRAHLLILQRRSPIAEYHIWKNCGSVALKLRTWSCGLRKKDAQNCGIKFADQHFFKKLRKCDCENVSSKLRYCDCGPKKKLIMPTSGYCVVQEYWGRPLEPVATSILISFMNYTSVQAESTQFQDGAPYRDDRIE